MSNPTVHTVEISRSLVFNNSNAQAWFKNTAEMLAGRAEEYAAIAQSLPPEKSVVDCIRDGDLEIELTI